MLYLYHQIEVHIHFSICRKIQTMVPTAAEPKKQKGDRKMSTMRKVIIALIVVFYAMAYPPFIGIYNQLGFVFGVPTFMFGLITNAFIMIALIFILYMYEEKHGASGSHEK